VSGIGTVSIKIQGEAPLLMHNVRLGNRFDPYTRRLKELHTAMKRKGADVDALETELADVEWEGGLYYGPKLGPYLPNHMIRAAIRDGARLTRGGRQVERTILVGTPAPVQYEGPREIDALKADPNFRDQRMVTIGQAKVLRTRPCFQEWSATLEIRYLTDASTEEDVRGWVRDAGLYVGFGDGRSMGFGRFALVE
jgi:hypothetical protein